MVDQGSGSDHRVALWVKSKTDREVNGDNRWDTYI